MGQATEVRLCRIEGCKGRAPVGTGLLCPTHLYRKRILGDESAEPMVGNEHASESYWPTDDRRPWETVSDWCRRLDGYYGAGRR